MDARIEGDYRVKDANRVAVKLQRKNEPVHLKVTSGKTGGTYSYSIEERHLSRTLKRYTLREGQPITLQHATTEVVAEATELSGGENLPDMFQLEQNYPNPFNPATSITYSLPEAAGVVIDIFTITGQHLSTLVKGRQEAGVHSVKFDASGLPSGVYLYRLKAGVFEQTRRMMLLK